MFKHKELAGVIGAARAVLRAAQKWGVLSVVLALVVLTVGRVSAQNLGSCVQPPLGMVSWWPGDGNPNDIVDGNHGTLVGSAGYASGVVDQAFSFTVAGDCVQVPTAPNLNFGPGDDLSIDAWILIEYPSWTATYLPIVDKRVLPNGPFDPDAVGYSLFLYNGSLAIQLGDGTFFNYISSGPDLRDVRPHHVAVTVDRNSATGGTLYVDGAVVLIFDPTNRPGDLTNNQPLFIGRHAGDPSVSVIGLIDEVEIFNRVLTAGEIKAIFAAGSAGKCKCVKAPCGMVSWWPGDWNTDDVVDGNPGTLVGTAGYAQGIVGQAFSFTAVGDCVQVPTAPNLDFGPAGSGSNGDLSIDAWILIPSGSPSLTATYLPIVDKRDLPGGPYAPQSTGYFLFLYDGRLAFQLGDGTFFNYISPGPNLLLVAGVWHHVAVTVDRNSPTGGNLYVDGAVVLNFNPTKRPGDLTNSQPLFIGRHAVDPSISVIGLIDEVEIFNRVLSPLDVWDIFNAKSAGKCKCVKAPCGMVSWWPGDANPNDIVDGSHGTLVGSAGYAPGMVGQAFSFTAVGDCVQVLTPVNLDFGPGDDLSIDAWIRTSSTIPVLPIVDKRVLPNGPFDPDAVGYFFFLYNGSLAFQLADTTDGFYNYISSGSGLSDGNWHHVAVTVDRNSTAGGTLYVDGAVVLIFDPTNRPGDLTNNQPLFIGRHAGDPSVSVIGLIDEVEIFNRVLTAGEVEAIFTAGSFGKCK
jgi:hypothetical protein